MTPAIAKAHEEDVVRARDMLRAAVSKAEEEWLPADAIIDALMLELIELAGRRRELEIVAAQLAKVADLVDRTETDFH